MTARNVHYVCCLPLLGGGAGRRSIHESTSMNSPRHGIRCGVLQVFGGNSYSIILISLIWGSIWIRTRESKRFVKRKRKFDVAEQCVGVGSVILLVVTKWWEHWDTYLWIVEIKFEKGNLETYMYLRFISGRDYPRVDSGKLIYRIEWCSVRVVHILSDEWDVSFIQNWRD